MLNKKYYIVSFFTCLTVIFGLAFPIQLTKAQTETTFPVEEAGIAAYVKLDSVDITHLTIALNYFYTREKQAETYVIGTVKVENKDWKNYPHLYIGLDGWMVAYYLKDEEASRIMQWKDYTPGVINTTTLKDAIDFMAYSIGVTYPAKDIKYYDFKFSDANKMTLIAETVPSGSNCFSVTIPGILYEGSYSTFAENSQTSYVCYNWPLILSIDGNIVYQSGSTCKSHWHYGYYDSIQLEANMPHFICVEKQDTGGHGIGAATVLIYQN